MTSFHAGARVLATLVKREFSEHRVLFLYAPLAGLAASLVWFCVWLFSDAATQQAERVVLLDRAVEANRLMLGDEAVQRFWDGFASAVIDVRYHIAEQAMLMLCWASMAYYALYNLYRQRANRSILFWNSLPVSDAQTIASKLLAGPVLGYLCYLLCFAVLDLGMFVIAAMHAWLTDSQLFARYLQNPTLFADAAEQIIRLPWTVLWALPVFGWLLLASAWAKSAPFAWAIGPWLLVIVVELALNDESWLFDRLAEHLMPIEAILVATSGSTGPLALLVSALLGLFFLVAAVRLNRSDAA